MFYLAVFYFAGGYRCIRGLSSAQCNLRSRRVHLCFDAFSFREAECTASSAAQNMTELDREKWIQFSPGNARANDALADDGGTSPMRRIFRGTNWIAVSMCSAATISGSCRRFIWTASSSAPHSGILAPARSESQSQRAMKTAMPIPASWAMMKASTPEGAMPANVSESDRAIVTAGLANDVEAVNQ
jgi:hypothetical protein